MEQWEWEGSFDNNHFLKNDFDNSELGHTKDNTFELMDFESTIMTKFIIESYDLVSSVNIVDEGLSVIVNLFTTYVDDGTFVPYTIIGKDINLNDFEGLTSLNGNFQVFDNKSTITFRIKQDNVDEKYEFFTILLNNNKASTTIKISGDPYIPDTSNPSLEIQYAEDNPNLPYTLTLSGPEKIGEDSVINLTLTTKSDFLQNWINLGEQIEGKSIGYKITGSGISSEDFYNPENSNSFSLEGYLVLDSNGVSTKKIGIKKDELTDEGSEKFRFELTSFPEIFVERVIIDKKYELELDIDQHYDSGILSVKLKTENVSNNTVLPFTIYPISNNISPDDFTNTNLNYIDGKFRGQFVIYNNYSLFDLNIRKDYFTEGPEQYILILDGNLASIPITIQDTSQFFPDYTTYEYSIEMIEGVFPENFSISSEIVEIDKEFYLKIKFEGDTGNVSDYAAEFKLSDNFSYDKFNTSDGFYRQGADVTLSGGNYEILLEKMENFNISFNVHTKIYSKSIDNKPIEVKEDTQNFRLDIERNYSSTRNQFLKQYFEEREKIDGEAYYHFQGVKYYDFEEYMKVLVDNLEFNFYE